MGSNGGYDEHAGARVRRLGFLAGRFRARLAICLLAEVFFDYRRTGDSMITRIGGMEDQIRDYVARKHGPLYRQAWQSLSQQRDALEVERQSVKGTLRHLRKLLQSRLTPRP